MLEPQVPDSLARQGVTQKTFLTLLSLGWVNTLGQSLDWTHWNESKTTKFGASSHAGRSR